MDKGKMTAHASTAASLLKTVLRHWVVIESCVILDGLELAVSNSRVS
ncbi:hypothetical protein [Paraburkholderia caffeinilytica]